MGFRMRIGRGGRLRFLGGWSEWVDGVMSGFPAVRVRACVYSVQCVEEARRLAESFVQSIGGVLIGRSSALP